MSHRPITLAKVCGTALLLLLFPLLPESPHWLAVSGDTAAAEATLCRMAHVNGVTMLPGRLGAAASTQISHPRGCDSGELQPHLYHSTL